MSKGSRSESGPSRFSEPFIASGANTLQNAYNANAGNIQNATNQVTGLLPDIIQRYQDGDAGVNAARDYNVGVLGGQYLDSNPYLDQYINDTNNDIVNQTQAALGVRGLTGGSSYADLISRNVARNTTGIRMNDYNNERNRMAQAAGQSGQLAAADYLSISPILSTLQASTTPIQAAESYAGGLGGLLGNSVTTRNSQGSGGLLGNALSLGAMFALSDVSAKENIKRVGKTDDGLGVFTYNYKGDPTPQMGVMAQEVDAKKPEASGPTVNGFRTVNYGAL